MDLDQSIHSEEEDDIQEDDIEEPSATPLWKYVTKVPVEKGSKGGGGSAKFICNFGCHVKPYTGSYSRVRAHLIGVPPGQKKQGVQVCAKLTHDDIELLKKEESDAKRMFGNSKARKKLPIEHQVCDQATVKGTVDNMFHITRREDVDQKIASCLYQNGVPFNIVRSPSWADLVHAINTAPKGYKSPNYEKVRTSLLDKEQIKVQQALTPLMQDWSTHGVSIISDGWSNLRNEALVNVMAVSGGRAIFIRAYEVSAVEKNAANIAELLFKAIDYVGPSNVVQVVTDNAANCKAAGGIIQRKHPHVFWSGCLAHTLNLLMKDIAKSKDPALSFVDETYKKGKAMVKYIKNHSSSQALFKSFSQLQLLKAKKTRFGHHYIVMHRLEKVRSALVSMVLSSQWGNLRRSSSAPEEHDNVRDTIMNDDFWRKVKRILRITKPIYRMLRFSDTDKTVIGEVYEQMDTMLGQIKDILSNDPVVYNLIHTLVVARWDKMNIPLHCLAYVLVPRYYTNAWLLKPTPGGGRRKKPHTDSEVQRGYLEAIEKIIQDPTEAGMIRQQISDFVSNKGVFAQPQAVHDRATMTALSWWHLYGRVAPALLSLALKVLSQSVNTSCAQRCWSTYSYIHSVKRNRLNNERAEKLVFVHYNQRLLSRYRNDYEKFKNWDVLGDDANIEEDLLTMEARENVSLSESEDEAVPGNNSIPTPSPASATSSSCPSPSLPSPSPEQTVAQRRLERARGKKQKK
ncbi:hypothetical protein RHSIM_Rhsim02G0002400 [Rhododendron simsii]|uniref:DUF659 domain-containing protein n=1 Tax=Rhododendron simsii TaxID=118357 RepID=A0A834HA91_RHOSS|nr:hypothetical protein RHSIM_Rhsim02G0002400 [Rhododendron simsii]